MIAPVHDETPDKLTPDSILGLACDRFTPEQKRFVEALVGCGGSVTVAAQRSGVGRTTHYKWTTTDETYRAAILLITEALIPALECHVLDMALNGVRIDTYDLEGNHVGSQVAQDPKIGLKLLEINRKRADAIRSRGGSDLPGAGGSPGSRTGTLSDDEIDARIRARLKDSGSDQGGNTVIEAG